MICRLFLFLAKLSYHTGINPELENCSLCGVEYKADDLCSFNYQEGGFICSNCLSQRDEFLSDNRVMFEDMKSANQLRVLIGKALQIPFKSYAELGELDHGKVASLFNYLNFQYGFSADKVKTWAMVSSY